MKEIRTNCSMCSLACPLVLRGAERSPIFGKDSLLALEYDRRPESVYNGSLCARGNAVVELLAHPKRVNYPFVLGERSRFAAAVKETAKNLVAIKKEFGSDAIGVILGDNLTVEEADTALRFARDVIGTSNIALFAPDDAPMLRAWLDRDLSGLRPAGAKPAGDRVVSLVFGDLFSEHPCTAKKVLPGKYGTRGSEIIVVSPESNHTAWFANRHLRCRPGGEAAVAAGLLKAAAAKSSNALVPDLSKLLGGLAWSEIERLGGVPQAEIEGAAASLLGAAKVATYISNIFGRIGAPGLTLSLAEALTAICPGERSFVPQLVQQNSWGVHSVIAAGGESPTIEKLAGGSLKALVILGLDLFSVYPAVPIERAMREKKFTVTTQLFWNQTAERANIVIPAASLMEKKGTVCPSFGEELVRGDVLAPPGGVGTDEEFLEALAKEIGVGIPAGGGIKRRVERAAGADGAADEWAAYAEQMKGLDRADTVLIPWSEAVHAADGSQSRNLHWPMTTCPDPKLFVSDEIAGKLGIASGDQVIVSTAGGEIALEAERTGKLAGRTAAATIHFPAVRKLFPWKYDEKRREIVLGPIPVRLSRQSEK